MGDNSNGKLPPSRLPRNGFLDESGKYNYLG